VAVAVPDAIDGRVELLEVLVERQREVRGLVGPKRPAVLAEVDGIEVEPLLVVPVG
jgi:hypothetical protein